MGFMGVRRRTGQGRFTPSRRGITRDGKDVIRFPGGSSVHSGRPGWLRRLALARSRSVQPPGHPGSLQPPGLQPPGRSGHLRRLGWRGRGSIIASLLFLFIVGLPAAVARLVHHTPPGTLVAFQTADARHAVSVYEMDTGAVVKMSVQDYVVDVLAAEFPPGTPKAALAAGAVAIRTYVAYAQSAAGKVSASIAQRHGAAVTDSGVIDLPMLKQAQQEATYGAQAGLYELRYEQAVAQTDGRILTYNGQPILSFLFPLSPGRTRDGSAVFHQALPYLAAVACPDDAQVAAGHGTFAFSALDLAQALHVPLTQVAPARFRVTARDSAGFVIEVHAGARAWSGQAFAALLKLPSGDFALAGTGGQLVVHTVGIGNDIGMSLHEATAMAYRGVTWQTILRTFYRGTKIANVYYS